MASTIKVDTIQDQDGNNIINENADVITVGASGDTITIPAGVTFDSSAATNTLPATVVTTTGTQTLTNKSIATTQLTGTITPSDSTVSLAKLTATGTQDATTFLRGDNTFAEPVAGGITMADQWRLTSDFTGTASPISSNLERVDTSGQGTIGSAMTVSSGVFTFPATGIYKVEFISQFVLNGDCRYYINYIQSTRNNGGTWTQISENRSFIQQTSSNWTPQLVYTCSLFDCADTSNHKVRFDILPVNTSTVTEGNTAHNETFFTFIRLGDT